MEDNKNRTYIIYKDNKNIYLIISSSMMKAVISGILVGQVMGVSSCNDNETWFFVFSGSCGTIINTGLLLGTTMFNTNCQKCIVFNLWTVSLFTA